MMRMRPARERAVVDAKMGLDQRIHYSGSDFRRWQGILLQNKHDLDKRLR